MKKKTINGLNADIGTMMPINIHFLETNEGQIEGVPNNPRYLKSEEHDKLKKSLKDSPELLQYKPLMVCKLSDSRFVVVCGNMRLHVCRELDNEGISGFDTLPCFVLNSNVPVSKIKEYAIKDNVQAGNWDWDELANDWDVEELQDWGVDCSFLDESEEETEGVSGEEDDESVYSTKIESPVYEITGAEPSIDECIDTHSVKELLAAIDNSNVSEEQKEMLRVCAYRFAKIDFRNMAEYYAHQQKEMQGLMEDNALVIIDFNKAIEKGFVEMTDRLMNIIKTSDKENDED